MQWRIINFLSCGTSGDLIHSLYAVKNICKKYNAKANLYIADCSYSIEHCESFTFDLEKTYDDFKELLLEQSYILNFGILPKNFNNELISLNAWRKIGFGKFETWTKNMNKTYDIDNIVEYKWIDVKENIKELYDKILIHSSIKRFNRSFDWKKLIELNNQNIFFITNNENEYHYFTSTAGINIPVVYVKTIFDMAKAISSCKFFVGNQSMPFALASSMDKNRLGVLSNDDSVFYMEEQLYSKNISWHLNEQTKYHSDSLFVKI